MQIDNIHYCLLIIAKEIKRICEKNNINYFMLAGTLLGAVRHKGYIPWDDDIDFGMLRSDYNAFIKACESDLNKEQFFLQSIETDKGYGKFYTRILLKGTYLDYNLIQNVNCQKCLFVDIFPYDSVPESKILQKKQSVITNFAFRLLKKKQKYIFDHYTMGTRLELLLTPFFTKKTLIKMYEKEVQKYNSNQNTTYINSPNAGYGYFKERLERNWFKNLIDYNFEDTTFPGPADYDPYLKHLYGDYMTIPPVEKQVTHNVQNIDFGIYKLEN